MPGQIDEFMNEMFITVFDERDRAQQPDIVRLELVKQIKLDLVSVKRNGSFARPTFSVPSDKESKKTEQKQNRRKKKRFYDTKKTKEALEANLVMFPPKRITQKRVFNAGDEPWYYFTAGKSDK
jgi:hypothetical protein